jgi:N-acetylglutamate synthase-like GNAT family acetyltransferase
MQRAWAFGRQAHLINGDYMIKIRLKSRNDNDRIIQYLKNNWGGEFILSKGKAHYCENLQGLIAEGDYSISGLCLFTIDENELEIVLIEAFKENQGVGTALLKEIESIAVENQIKRVWLVTTNDNLNAMRFYIKKGLSFKRIERNVVEEYRKQKPGIPLVGNYGIPIMDELEFEKIL